MTTYPPPQNNQPQAVQSMTYTSPDAINHEQTVEQRERAQYEASMANEKGGQQQPQQHQQYQQQQPPPNYYQTAQNPPSGVTPINQLGEFETYVDCPNCHHRAMTRVTKEDSAITILVGIGLGCICICAACLPCIFHWFPDVHHDCSNCGRRLATRKQNGAIQVYGVAESTMPNAPVHMAPQGQVNVQRPEGAVVKGN